VSGDIWIGLVRVGQLPGREVFTGNRRAFVNALAPATSAADFQVVVSARLAELQLVAIEFEDVEPFADRAGRHVLDDDLVELAQEAWSRHTACFHTFHTYPNDEA
jgi:hypothetical protein